MKSLVRRCIELILFTLCRFFGHSWLLFWFMVGPKYFCSHAPVAFIFGFTNAEIPNECFNVAVDWIEPSAFALPTTTKVISALQVDVPVLNFYKYNHPNRLSPNTGSWLFHCQYSDMLSSLMALLLELWFSSIIVNNFEGLPFIHQALKGRTPSPSPLYEIIRGTCFSSLLLTTHLMVLLEILIYKSHHCHFPVPPMFLVGWVDEFGQRVCGPSSGHLVYHIADDVDSGSCPGLTNNHDCFDISATSS